MDMIFKANFSTKHLISKYLCRINKINKARKDFFISTLVLFLSIKGKINFLQLARHSNHGEQMYRIQFEKQFDFMNFNKEIIQDNFSDKRAIAFDPSYISKSGKKTYGVDKFWSGVAGQAKFGLEIGGIGVIDIENNTALHLEAVQTPGSETLEQKDMTLVDWYADVIVSRKDTLLNISKYVVADAYFSKRPFADAICTAGMNLISRFRNDADLYYLYTGERRKGPGRPRKYTGKVDFKNIDTNYFKLESQDKESIIYSAVVYSKALKRNIKLVYQKLLKGKKSYLLFFSTDITMDGPEILSYYKTRFQIEFVYRDAKQFTGLHNCQARSGNKLNFHFNASLTAINIAKVEHWLSIPKEIRPPFSMADVKTMYHNTLLLERFIKLFAVPAHKLKNNHKVKELINYGRIAA